jgi:hypothetical protein
MNWGRVFLSFGLLSLIALAAGCAKTPEQKLMGKWKGSPDVSDEISKIIRETGGGQELPEEAFEIQNNIAQVMGKIASRMTMGMELHLESGGQAAFKGHTESLGLLGDVKGSWEVIPKDSDRLFMRMGTKDHQVEGKVFWRDEDAFYFQFEAPMNAKTELSGLFVEPVQAAADTEPNPAGSGAAKVADAVKTAEGDVGNGDAAKPAEEEKPKVKIVTMLFTRRITDY